jgi:hypothetical protein
MVVQASTEHRVAISLRDVILACVIYCLGRVKGETTQQKQKEGGKSKFLYASLLCPSTEVIMKKAQQPSFV